MTNNTPDDKQQNATGEPKSKANKKTYQFKTEVTELLHLMVHSLYSNKEIFLRELISNASDACEKLRFLAVQSPELMANMPEMAIEIDYDSENKWVSIYDTGIGMTEEEAKTNLGTIAKSGTADFIKQMKEQNQTDSAAIGQFGVGFYSAFMVAHQVEVLSCKAGTTEGVRWISDGSGKFSIQPQNDITQGTKIIVHLNDDGAEFADYFRLQHLVKKYSDYLALPVKLKSMPPRSDEGAAEKDTTQDQEPVFETINKAKALWLEPKRKVKDDEYKDFYKHIATTSEEPLLWSHNKVEGQLEYASILYIPSSQPFDLWQRDNSGRGLKLFVQRVFIMDKVDAFLPLYLRFVKGVLDSNDLDLNVSREILQDSPVVTKIKSALTKRVLDLLTETAEKEKNTYQKFWNNFGMVLKEGVAEEMTHKEALLALMRFRSTNEITEDATVSFDEYISRMPETQKDLYYVVADNPATARKSPHLEVFKKNNIEVLLLTDPIDDWFINMVFQYQDKNLKNVAQGDIDASEWGKKESDKDNKTTDNKESKKTDTATESPEIQSLLGKLKTVLQETTEDVRISNRLTDSPCCLVLAENALTPQLRQLMKMSGQDVPETKPILEINPEHTLIKRLLSAKEKQTADFDDLAHIVFEQAQLAEEGTLKDPIGFLARVNRFLV